jgi:hypothetical protein
LTFGRLKSGKNGGRDWNLTYIIKSLKIKSLQKYCFGIKRNSGIKWKGQAQNQCQNVADNQLVSNL